MAKQRSSFAKLQRDKAKKERAANKRANRREKRADEVVEATSVDGPEILIEEGTPVITGKGELSAADLLTLIEDLHSRKAAGTISDEEFEEAKVELFARLPS